MKIYRLFCEQNKKAYVGITTDMKRRMAVHFNTKEPTVLGRAIRKYGRDAFSVSILEEVSTVEEACKKEIFYIKTLNTRAPHGMNMTDGGEGVFGLRHTDATRLKMSNSHIGKGCGDANPMFGKVGANKGKKFSAETCAKMSASMRGRVPWNKGKICPQLSGVNNHFFGKSHTAKTKEKLRISQTGHRHTEETKIQMSKDRKGIFVGSKHGMSKVTEKIVLEIRALYATKTKTQCEIAVMFGLTQSMISNIVQRKNWTHI